MNATNQLEWQNKHILGIRNEIHLLEFSC
uniref:Uncharacterized protein n=1 Tax=Arundo donax TaxID=35708 RepID=A0A0A9HNK7_ARUDO